MGATPSPWLRGMFAAALAALVAVPLAFAPAPSADDVSPATVSIGLPERRSLKGPPAPAP